MKLSNDYPSLKTRPKSKIFGRFFLLLTFLFVLGAGFIVGQSTVSGREKLNLNEFWQAYNIIENRFVGTSDPVKSAEGAISGLVASLGDPFSSYLPAKAKKALDTELSGQFEGIGAELTMKNDLVTVVAPIDSSPAEKAGLKAKDIILKVDETSTEGLTLEEVVTKVRGPKDSSVKLTILREKTDQPLEITITRGRIVVNSVKSSLLADNIGYVEISQFGDDTVDLFKKAVADLSKSQPKAIILDLRNNPGGYLNTVAPIVGQFIAPNVIVKERYKDGKIDEIRSTEAPTLPNTPMYVLVNAGSASAAEIVAGALQDYERATVVGQKTFGKGSVQELFPLKAGSALRLTIAEWLTPKDRQISKKGIEPNVAVEGDKTVDSDPVLAKALELIGKL